MKSKVSPIVILLAAILVIGGLVFVFSYASKNSLFGLRIGDKKTSQEDLKDSDNDGLKDWEEELYRTDPFNPDTDGDSYLDGEEINSGHNPLIKAPGDKLTFYPIPLGDSYNITKKVLSEEAIDSILDSYLAQKGEYIGDHPEINSPETFTTFTKESTIQTMSERSLIDSYPILMDKASETLADMPKIFDINIFDENINISEDNSPEAIRLYLNNVSFFLNSNTFFLKEESFNAISVAIKDGDFSQLNELIKINDTKIEKIKNISVPSSWKEIHKEGLRLTIKIRNIFVSFRDIQNDPLRAYLAVQELENFADDWNKLMADALSLATNQGIKLSL